MKTRKWKKTLLTFVLIGALLGVQVMEIAAYAAETDTGTVEPVEVCSNYTQLFIAVNNANDGDVIGIDSVIDVQNEALDLGASDKHVTIVRMNESACLQVSTKEPCTFRNLTFDGNEYASNASMIEVYSSGAKFENVTFQNCICRYTSGAVMIFGKNNTFTNCTFQNNSGGTGGHLCISNDAVVTITGCNFTNGSATKGGAIYRINSGTIGAWVTIEQSKIYGNSASESGGGIYAEDTIIARNAKIYGNTAPLGEDITDTPYTSVQIHDDLETLQQIYADENIKVNGWTITLDDVTGNRYVKLNYEEIVQEPTEPGDTEEPDDTGNDTTDPTDPGDDTDEPPTDTEDTGTDEEPSTPTEPSVPDEGEDGDQEEPTEPSQPDDSDQDATEEPSEPTAPGDPDDGQEEPATPPGDDSDEGDTQTPSNNNTSNTTTDNSVDNSDHSTHDDHSTSTTDNSKTDNSKTDNSTVTEDNSSVVNNYYYTTENPGQQNQQQTQIQTPAPQVIVVKDSSSDKDETSNTQTLDPSNNIRIEAEGADVIFEVVDGVYSISIKAEEPSESVQEVQTVTTAAPVEVDDGQSLNWYETIKIALLAALVVNVMRKPKTT